jgi:hypothetical protein
MPYNITVPAQAVVQGERILIKLNKKWLEQYITKHMGARYIEYMFRLMGCEQTEHPELVACELARRRSTGEVEVNPVTYLIALKYIEEVARHFKMKL